MPYHGGGLRLPYSAGPLDRSPLSVKVARRRFKAVLVWPGIRLAKSVTSTMENDR